ncbi:MAG: 1,6-anhydro-N-acetylmuramyl-L-alanine amidase AmpD [Gammaproteobacteria bacterium]|nr:1,6-anhydro-N-acetylmuramyl-L-alanine amidase AmpD [Gammaproteobacteria bacterium]
MRLSINQDSLLTPALFLPSPHCDDRPSEATIDLIVIHNISLPPGEFGTGAIEDFFCGKLDPTQHPYYSLIVDLTVSAHLLIKRNGQLIQFVPFNKRAWHAGVSNYQGRERCNDFSIGIELEGTDSLPYEPMQYDALSAVVKVLKTYYPCILSNAIVGHSDIAPLRKTDPGAAFNWDYFRELLA